MQGVDGVDIQSLNLRWLRSQMGLVGQQPVLFDTTIFENIRYGGVSLPTQASGEALKQQIVAVAKLANAHDFILALPEGYETRVGENATQLSGGQKQRIAIARALMRDPKILLLDEATSALDATSELAVQLALDKAAEQRTTIVIAHRLSTIRHADNIIVMSDGCVVEQGAHADLMALDGHYARLVRAQQMGGQAQDRNLHDDDEDGVVNAATNGGDDYDDETALLSAAAPPAGCTVKEGSLEFHAEAKKPKTWGLGSTLAFIIRMNRDERWILCFGLICSIFAGLGLPGLVSSLI